MAQGRQQNNAVWPRYVQPAIVQQAVAAPGPRAVCEQLEQLNRKLAAAHAEIRRYQTRLFACERQMIALRKENAELEAACEQAQEEALQLRAALQDAHAAEPEQPDAPAAAAAEEQAAPEPPEEPAAPEPEPPQESAPQPAEPEWQPKTELEHLSVELIKWFDEMMDT